RATRNQSENVRELRLLTSMTELSQRSASQCKRIFFENVPKSLEEYDVAIFFSRKQTRAEIQIALHSASRPKSAAFFTTVASCLLLFMSMTELSQRSASLCKRIFFENFPKSLEEHEVALFFLIDEHKRVRSDKTQVAGLHGGRAMRLSRTSHVVC